MINVTVKTLDSQNHAFSVEDEITIAQFKEKISDTVIIPPETQRLIYCGRVLQDSSKLKDYDVDGKVIHLVQRPPPASVLRPDAPDPQPQPHRRVRGVEYVGTVRLPVSGIENTLHSLPINSLANSRLNVARRMISRAETVLNALENPNRQDQPAQSEPQEEATPVFEARVVIPNPTVFSATEETVNMNGPVTVDPIIQAQEIALPEDFELDPLTNDINNADTSHSVSSTPEMISPLARSTENLSTVDVESGNVVDENTTAAVEEETATNDATSNGATFTTLNMSHTSEFADILDSLNRLHTRFMPFMEQYNNFMRTDLPSLPDTVRSTQAMINRVSELCHYLGHAYHSISDIIVRVRTPPPRPLLCRPMLIQHSAVVQAQINIPTDRNNTSATTAANTDSPASPPAQGTVNPIPGNFPETPFHSLLGLPLPRSGLRVETYRLPFFEGNSFIRNNNNTSTATLRTSSNSATSNTYVTAIRSLDTRARPVSTTAASTPTTTSAEQLAQAMDVGTAIASSVVNSVASNMTAENGVNGNTINVSSGNIQGGPNHPNVEFFMEVTPERITIDSLETAFVGANQANELNAMLQESMNPPPPQFIQSLMQMAGQLINRSNLTSNITASTTSAPTTTTSSTPIVTPTAPPLEVSTSDAAITTATSGVGAARTTPFQNSQARGDTQTQPTTATHTRSTPRPHVHLAQHTMHAFDPFLPCNSHHVLPRRRFHNANNGIPHHFIAPQYQQYPHVYVPPQPPAGFQDDSTSGYSIIRNFLNSVRTTYANSLPPAYWRLFQDAMTRGSLENDFTATRDLMNAATSWLRSVPEGAYIDRRPTISRTLQHFPDNTYVLGENIITDILILLCRGFSLGDIVQLNNGHPEPLLRFSTELRTFILRFVLGGDASEAGYERAVEKILEEMQIFLEHLGQLLTVDDIDIVLSVQSLFRVRLPSIIALTMSRNPNSTRLMYEQVRTTIQQLGALIIYSTENGIDGIPPILDRLLRRLMEGVPNDIQQWCLQFIKPHLMSFLNNLIVPENLLQRYLVRVDTSIQITDVRSLRDFIPEPEPMQVEELELVQTVTVPDEVIPPTLNITDDSEALPTVVLGSSPWHAQVPSDWVPIIVRDTQRQRKQNSQPPFSDAYLSGMPSKRRKLADCNKPPGSISQVISESVRRAVTTTGLTSVAPVDTVSEAAGADGNIRSAYRDLLHNSVHSELENNEDFTPEQFPNVDSFFNNRPQ